MLFVYQIQSMIDGNYVQFTCFHEKKNKMRSLYKWLSSQNHDCANGDNGNKVGIFQGNLMSFWKSLHELGLIQDHLFWNWVLCRLIHHIWLHFINQGKCNDSARTTVIRNQWTDTETVSSTINNHKNHHCDRYRGENIMALMWF